VFSPGDFLFHATLLLGFFALLLVFLSFALRNLLGNRRLVSIHPNQKHGAEK
jgi:hypothetical protein